MRWRVSQGPAAAVEKLVVGLPQSMLLAVLLLLAKTMCALN